MQRKIRLMIGILIMTGLIAGCWKVSKNLQKELKEEMEKIGEKSFRAKQIYQWLHKEKVTDFEEMTNISKALSLIHI